MDTFTWYDSDNNSVDLTLPEYLVQDFHGFGGAEVRRNIQTTPHQHGALVLDTRLEPREMQLDVRLLATSLAGLWTLRRELVRLFNPIKGEGRLRWERDDGSVMEIGAYPDETPDFAGEMLPTTQMAMISLLAPDPLFYDPAQRVESFATGSASVLNNAGDTETPVEILLTGPITGASVRNTAIGKRYELSVNIGNDEAVRITSRFGNRRVVRIGPDGQEDNAMHWLTEESEFWGLVPGSNEIQLLGSGGGSMELRWFNRYLGA